MRLLCCLVATLLVGCGGIVTRPAPTSNEFVYAYPKFSGEPAGRRISWDLQGIWRVSRFGTKERPGKLGRWEATWNLQYKDVAVSGVLVDQNKQGCFWLSTWEVGGEVNGVTRVADVLVWEHSDGKRWYLSVNEQSFGLLMMTGNDGEQYMAVRSD